MTTKTLCQHPTIAETIRLYMKVLSSYYDQEKWEIKELEEVLLLALSWRPVYNKFNLHTK